jgi:hypothetical protein
MIESIMVIMVFPLTKNRHVTVVALTYINM